MYLTNMVRSEGDPKIIRSGKTSSLGMSDSFAKALGWFSLGLGAVELFAPKRVTRALGMEGHETLVRAYGAREIMSGIMTLSPDKTTGLKSRLAGDGIDIATLLAAYRQDNPKKDNVAVALAMVGGVTVLDWIGAQATQNRHGPKGRRMDFRNRSGFPKGIAASRGLAKDLQAPPPQQIIPPRSDKRP
jgi:hypothetical protein